MAGGALVVARTSGNGTGMGTGKAKLNCWSKPGKGLSSRGCLLALADVAEIIHALWHESVGLLGTVHHH